MADTPKVVYDNRLYFFNDQYYDDIVRRNIFDLYNRTYQHSQLTQQIMLDFDCHTGKLADFRVDNAINRKYGMPKGTYSYKFDFNIIPYFNEKRYIDLYAFKTPISLYDLCKDKGTFANRIKFSIADYTFMSLRVIPLEDKTTLLCIYPSNNDGITPEDFEKFVEDDVEWKMDFENPSDIYYAYLEKSRLFPSGNTRIPVSVFPKLNNILFNKPDMENEWTIYISASESSPNLLESSMCKIVTVRNTMYFEISERFKNYIDGLAQNCKVYVTNDYDMIGRYLYSGHGPLAVLLDFEANPVLSQNIVVNEYDAFNDRLIKRLDTVIDTYYPNVYDFSGNNGFVHNNVTIEPDEINFASHLGSGITGYAMASDGTQYVCGKKGFLAKAAPGSLMWTELKIDCLVEDEPEIPEEPPVEPSEPDEPPYIPEPEPDPEEPEEEESPEPEEIPDPEESTGDDNEISNISIPGFGGISPDLNDNMTAPGTSGEGDTTPDIDTSGIGSDNMGHDTDKGENSTDIPEIGDTQDNLDSGMAGPNKNDDATPDEPDVPDTTNKPESAQSKIDFTDIIITPDDRILVVGDINAFISTDGGLTWSQRAFDREINKALYANRKFYIVGNNGLFAYSDSVSMDTDWTVQEIPDIDADLKDICYRHNEFVIVGAIGTILVSQTAMENTWVKKPIIAIDDMETAVINSIIWNNDRYIGVGLNGLVIESINGDNWYHVDTTLTNDLYDIIYYGNYYVVGKNIIATSISGSSWYSYLTDLDFDDNTDIIYTHIFAKDNSFILAARTADDSKWDYANASPLLHVTYSTYSITKDTIEMLSPTNPNESGYPITGIIDFNEKLFACRSNGKIYKYDNETDAWIDIVPGNTDPLMYACKIDDQKAVMVGYNGTTYYTADAGESWSKVKIPITRNFYCVKYVEKNKTLIAVGTKGSIATSTNDGQSWSSLSAAEKSYDFLCVDHNGSKYVIGTNTGKVICTSNLYNLGNLLDVGTTSPLTAIACYKGEYIAVTENGVMFRSVDGTSWSRTFTFEEGENTFISIDKTDGTYIMSTAEGVMFVSDNTYVWDKIDTKENLAIFTAIKHGSGYKYGSTLGIGNVAYSKMRLIQNFFYNSEGTGVVSVNENKNQLLFGMDESTRLFSKLNPYFYINTKDGEWKYLAIDADALFIERIVDITEFYSTIYVVTRNGHIYTTPVNYLDTTRMTWSHFILDSFIAKKFAKVNNTLFCFGLLNGENAIAYKFNDYEWRIVNNIGDDKQTRFLHVPTAVTYVTTEYLFLCEDGKFYSSNDLEVFNLSDNSLPEIEYIDHYNDIIENNGILTVCGDKGSIYTYENDGYGWVKREIGYDINLKKIYLSNGLFMVLSDSPAILTSIDNRNFVFYDFQPSTKNFKTIGLYIDYGWNVCIVGGAFDKFKVLFEGGKNLYISYYEAKHTANNFDNNFADYIDFIGNAFVNLAITGNLTEPFNAYKPIMDFLFDYPDYIKHPAYGDIRAYMIYKLMELLHDNPNRYNKLYEEIDIRNYDHIHSSFIIKEYPEILERSVMDTEEFELIEDDIVWFKVPHTYIEITNTLGFNKPVVMYIDGYRYLYTATTTVKNIQRIFFPVDAITADSVIVLDSPMYASSFAYSKHTTQITFNETGESKPFPSSSVFGKVKGCELLYFDLTTNEYLDGSRFAIAGRINKEDIVTIFKGKEENIKYGVSEENFLLSSEPLWFLTSDEEKIRLQKEQVVVPAPDYGFVKPIDSAILELTTDDFGMTNRTIGITNTDTYRLGRIPDFSKQKVFEFPNFREKPDLNHFYFYAEGKLLTPEQMEKVIVTMPERYGDTISFDFSALEFEIEDTEIIIEYYPTTDIRLYDGDVMMGDYVLTIFNEIEIPRAYKIEELRIFVDGLRVAKHQVLQVPGCNLFAIKDMAGEHHLTIIAYKTDPDPYEFNNETSSNPNKLNNQLAGVSTEYARFLYLKYYNR